MTINYQNPADMWAREGGSEVSDLVSLLAEVACIHDFSGAGPDVQAAADLAVNLKEPVIDWEGAARSEGWELDTSSPTLPCYKRDHGEIHEAANWSAACKLEGVRPDLLPVQGHWVVSGWLADRLIEKGERVIKGLAGLTIWARTSREPDIAADAVLQQIAHEAAGAASNPNEAPSP